VAEEDMEVEKKIVLGMVQKELTFLLSLPQIMRNILNGSFMFFKLSK